MGTRMEVAQLESRLNADDYRKLQSLFVVSIFTLSYKYLISTLEGRTPSFLQETIHPFCNIWLLILRFSNLVSKDSLGTSRFLSRTEFIDLAWPSVGRGSKEEYGLLFDNVVVTQENRGLLLDSDAVKEEGRVDWPGLCSFLLLELRHKVKNTKNTRAWKAPRIQTCPHRQPIQKVLYLPNSAQYLTVSKGGTVSRWDGENVRLLHTHQLEKGTVTPKDVWVTDTVLLPNVHKMAVSFTSKEIYFYDILSKDEFSCKYKIQGLQFTPWCLDYWGDPSLPDQAVFTIGDVAGWVSALYFTSAQISMFERVTKGPECDSVDVILWDELVRGKHRHCYTVTHCAHAPAWVRKARYLASLEAFVSCSTDPQRSMVIGWRERGSRRLRLSTYTTKRGVWDVDYLCGLSLIATAGVDHQVLLWNPYVTSELVCVLGGHTSPVTAVHFMQNHQQLLSYSNDKVLCLWDVSNQLCLHRWAGIFPHTRDDTHTLLQYQEEHQHLLLTFNSLLVLLEPEKVERRTSSHKHPVTCVLYNSLFRQVVSSDSTSSVTCWSVDTGQKVKQFGCCHVNAKISTLALDGTQTRLFTAGTDGEVKVWDFYGRCLHRMNAGLGRPVNVSQVLLLKTSIVVMGWERLLTVFRLQSFTQCLVEPSEWKGGAQHCSDVLCAAFQPPQTLVTGSHDGEIIVWNSVTEKAVKKLQPQNEHDTNKKKQGFFLGSHHRLKGKKDPEHCNSITRLFFIPGRALVGTGGPDLLSCGGLGVVRVWNTLRGSLEGQFTAHQRNLGSIIMSISSCGKYLATADREGTVKMWDIEDYCLKLNDTTEQPEPLQSFQPHRDHVTNLEMCSDDGRLFLLSSSSDCNVALSLLTGETIGFFGQEDNWYSERCGPVLDDEQCSNDGQGRSKRSPGGQEMTYATDEDER